MQPLEYVGLSQWLRDHGHTPGDGRWERIEEIVGALDADYLRHQSQKQRESANAA